MSIELNKLKSIFDKLSYTKTESHTFSEILDNALIPFRYYTTADEQKEAFSTYQSFPNAQLFSEFLIELGNLSEGLQDPIGEFYMLNISYGRLGQYFTPQPVTDMTARMIIDEKSKPGARILDPACGSGRFLLSAARINRNFLFYGADLDPICCKMALLNMLLNSLTGEIANMDSLSNQFFRGYKVQTKLINGHHYPFFIEFTDPEESAIWLRPLKKNEGAYQETKKDHLKPVFIQGDLFSQT